MSEQILKNKCCNYFYFFDNKNWIEVDCVKNGRVVKLKSIHNDLVKLIKKHGVRFKTVDDDNGDDQYGYYWSKHIIDFEPLDHMEADRGHTMLYYKEPKKDWQVL